MKATFSLRIFVCTILITGWFGCGEPTDPPQGNKNNNSKPADTPPINSNGSSPANPLPGDSNSSKNNNDLLTVSKKEDKSKEYIILDTLTDQFDRAKAKANAEDTLSKHSDIDAMVGLFAYNPPLILEALKQAEKVGKVKVIAFDEDDATLQGIKDGIVHGTVVQNPYMYGYKSIEILSALKAGEKDVIPENKFIDIPARQIRKNNVDEFWADLKSHNAADNVVMLVFSEFGRRVRENGGGTDHGAAGVAFMIGPKVQGDLYGEYPSIETDHLIEGDLAPTMDFRDLYSSIIADWMGLDEREILKGQFQKPALFTN